MHQHQLELLEFMATPKRTALLSLPTTGQVQTVLRGITGRVKVIQTLTQAKKVLRNQENEKAFYLPDTRVGS